jgi:hypothetical protein
VLRLAGLAHSRVCFGSALEGPTRQMPSVLSQPGGKTLIQWRRPSDLRVGDLGHRVSRAWRPNIVAFAIGYLGQMQRGQQKDATKTARLAPVMVATFVCSRLHLA